MVFSSFEVQLPDEVWLWVNVVLSKPTVSLPERK